MSIVEKISISPKTGNFPQKDVSDGVINKHKQKATVKGLGGGSHFPVYQDA